MKQGTLSGPAGSHQCDQIPGFFREGNIAKAKPAILEFKTETLCLKGKPGKFAKAFESLKHITIVNGIIFIPAKKASHGKHGDFSWRYRHTIQKGKGGAQVAEEE